MALQDIIEKIISDAKAEANQIVSRAEEEAKRRIEDKKKEIEKEFEKVKGKIKEEAQTHKMRLIQIASLELKKKVLAKKQELINRLFSELENKLLSLPEDKYINFLANRIAEASETGEEEIILNQNDKEKIGKKLVEKVNSILNKNGKRGNLILSESTANIKGGFILKSGKSQINGSIEYILKQIREEKLTEIAKKLFG